MEHADHIFESWSVAVSLNIRSVGAMVSSVSGYRASLLFCVVRRIPVKLMQSKMQK